VGIGRGEEEEIWRKKRKVKMRTKEPCVLLLLSHFPLLFPSLDDSSKIRRVSKFYPELLGMALSVSASYLFFLFHLLRLYFSSSSFMVENYHIEVNVCTDFGGRQYTLSGSCP
jgi:hypothetical protein